MAGMRPNEMLIVLVIVLLLFGRSQLPKLARSVGRAQKEFKAGLDDGASEAADAETTKDS